MKHTQVRPGEHLLRRGRLTHEFPDVSNSLLGSSGRLQNPLTLNLPASFPSLATGTGWEDEAGMLFSGWGSGCLGSLSKSQAKQASISSGKMPNWADLARAGRREAARLLVCLHFLPPFPPPPPPPPPTL